MPDFAACWYLLLIMNPVTKNVHKALPIRPDWSWKNNHNFKITIWTSSFSRCTFVIGFYNPTTGHVKISTSKKVKLRPVYPYCPKNVDRVRKKTTLFSRVSINIIGIYLSKNISILLCIAAWLLPQKNRSKKAKKWIEKERSVVYEIVYLSRSSAHSCFSSSLASFDWFWMRRANRIVRGLMRIVK